MYWIAEARLSQFTLFFIDFFFQALQFLFSCDLIALSDAHFLSCRDIIGKFLFKLIWQVNFIICQVQFFTLRLYFYLLFSNTFGFIERSFLIHQKVLRVNVYKVIDMIRRIFRYVFALVTW